MKDRNSYERMLFAETEISAFVSGQYDVRLNDLYPDEMTVDLELLILFKQSLVTGNSSIGCLGSISRYFPSIHSHLKSSQSISSLENVMMVCQPLHTHSVDSVLPLNPSFNTVHY